jgi:glycine/D-amino acid oxidase-like deaminating enzyme
VLRTFDLVVVGAGIVGAMTVCLARREKPDWNILILDRSFVGDGSTRYSLGLDIPYGHSAGQKQLSLTSERLFRQLQTIIPDLPFQRLPLYGVASEARAGTVIGNFTGDTVHRADCHEEETLRRSYPDFRLPAGDILLAGCEGVYASPQIIASRLIDWSVESGMVECWEGVEAREVRACGGNDGDDGFTLATTDGRSVQARRVLMATGPWLLQGPTADFAAGAGVRIKKTAALHIARRPAPHDPILFFFEEDAFLLPLHERGEWMFSFTSQEWDVAPEISQLKISGADRDLALAILHRYCPSFVADCRGGRVFCDAYSPDRVPLVRQVSGMRDYIAAGACSGSGYRLAPAIALEALKQFS